MRPVFKKATALTILLSSAVLAGCGGQAAYLNAGPESEAYMPERRTPPPAGTEARAAFMADWQRDRAACEADALASTGFSAAGVQLASAASGVTYGAPAVGLPLSIGDRVRLTLPEGEAFEGLYVIGVDGALQVPQVGAIAAAGRTVQAVTDDLAAALVDRGLFRAAFAQPSLTVTTRGAASVAVSGAVFQPGMVQINARSAEDLARQDQVVSGDGGGGRRLSAALRAAAGVRPDADLSAVQVRRGGETQVLDLRGLVEGRAHAGTLDIALADGDSVHVPEKGCFQPSLARASAVTAPGIRVYMSNLTVPAASNAQSAIGKDQTSLPYGTRLLQGLVAANCVGGVQLTNARRHAVLISTNPVTQRSEVIQRPIEDLVRDAGRDAFNPVLMPGDAIACYDSDITTIRDVARGFSDVLTPLALAGLLAL